VKSKCWLTLLLIAGNPMMNARAELQLLTNTASLTSAIEWPAGIDGTELPGARHLKFGAYLEVPHGLSELSSSHFSASHGRRRTLNTIAIYAQSFDDLSISQLVIGWTRTLARAPLQLHFSPDMVNTRRGLLQSRRTLGFAARILWLNEQSFRIGYLLLKNSFFRPGAIGLGGVNAQAIGASFSPHASNTLELSLNAISDPDYGTTFTTGLRYSLLNKYLMAFQWRSVSRSLAFSIQLSVADFRGNTGFSWHPDLGISRGFGFGVVR